MSFIQDFRQFAMKGNVVDMAVGVIIGGAFGKIVSSLVGDVIMPAIGIILGKVNFSELSIVVGSATIAYGKFIQSVVDFVIVAFVIFLVIKQISRFRRQPEPVTDTPPAPPEDIKLLTEIRDLLKVKNV